MTIAVIYGGTRNNGNTKALTDKTIQGLDVKRIYLRDYVIHSIEDQRHIEEGFQAVNDDYNDIVDQMLLHDIFIFVTPIYWFGMSGIMKNFIDRWSQTMRDPMYPDFKNNMATKKAFVIAVGGDEPNIKGLPLIQQFHYIFNFIGISFEGYILGEGNKPGDIAQDEQANIAADQLKKKFQSISNKVKEGGV